MTPKTGPAAEPSRAAAGEMPTGPERVSGAFRTARASGAEERETARTEARHPSPQAAPYAPYAPYAPRSGVRVCDVAGGAAGGGAASGVVTQFEGRAEDAG
ncbi:hypothetical protein ABT084_20805 [Streptomyces sp. NPDC002138]|uniref:hypothetical protein n=1 Tax=Streptomyces sp. NPDC002138 TaxID=3154410 RepID=UPI00332D169F